MCDVHKCVDPNVEHITYLSLQVYIYATQKIRPHVPLVNSASMVSFNKTMPDSPQLIS